MRPPLLKPQKIHKKPRPLRACNPKRKAEKYEKNFSGEGATDHGDFIRELSCAVFNCNGGPIEAAHTVARGAGGSRSSWRKLIPLCRKHHTGPGGQEGRTEDFGREHGLDLDALAEVLVVGFDLTGQARRDCRRNIARARLQMTPAKPALFYLLDTRHMVGNCALWWRPDGQGYTCDLRDAGKYSEDEALKIQRASHREHLALPCWAVDALAALHVDGCAAKRLTPLAEEGASNG